MKKNPVFPSNFPKIGTIVTFQFQINIDEASVATEIFESAVIARGVNIKGNTYILLAGSPNCFRNDLRNDLTISPRVYLELLDGDWHIAHNDDFRSRYSNVRPTTKVELEID